MKQIFVVRNPESRVYYRGTAIEVVSSHGSRVVGFRHIESLYVHQDIEMRVKTAIEIAKHVPLYFIDKRVKLRATLSLEV